MKTLADCIKNGDCIQGMRVVVNGALFIVTGMKGELADLQKPSGGGQYLSHPNECKIPMRVIDLALGQTFRLAQESDLLKGEFLKVHNRGRHNIVNLSTMVVGDIADNVEVVTLGNIMAVDSLRREIQQNGEIWQKVKRILRETISDDHMTILEYELPLVLKVIGENLP